MKIIKFILILILILITSCSVNKLNKRYPAAVGEVEISVEYKEEKDSFSYTDSIFEIFTDTNIFMSKEEEVLSETIEEIQTPTETTQIEQLEENEFTVNQRHNIFPSRTRPDQPYISDITHVFKDTMYYNQVDTVELVISYNYPISKLKKEIGTFSHSNIVTQEIRTTPYMMAKLIDPTNSFIIVPITDSIQIIEHVDFTFTLWQWKVTPVKGGMTELILNVDMIIDDHRKSLKIYEDKIYVDIKKGTSLFLWVQKYWTYITYIIAGICTIIAWMYKEKIIKFFKKSEDEKE